MLCGWVLAVAVGLTAQGPAQAAGGRDGRQAAVLTVSAAISLTDALEAAERAYHARGDGPVRFNFAASNLLARQIVSGAPVDLYISADETQMDVAAHAGAIDVNSRIDLLGNHLAIIARPDHPGIAAVEGLLDPSIRRIAIGDPSAVPAGVYARLFLQTAGLWDRLQAKLVPVGNVRAALAAVENGSANVAIGYESDAAAARHARVVLLIDGPRAPRIVYPAAIVSRSRNTAAAARFLSFLRGAEATRIFKTFRFVPLAPLP
ncbi:MAG: molybdate ABC transporter substrate-binding protein [Acidobacteriota bacterium]